MATIVSFASKKISTTANTTVVPVSIFGARLFSGTSAAVTVHIHDPGISATTSLVRSTSASTRVGTLSLTGKGIDELGYPTRCYGGTLIVTPTTTSATVYLYVR